MQKMKFNWGTGIVLAFIIMIGGMSVLVSIAIRQDFDLVENDYYQKSIHHQEHIDRVNNNELLIEKISFNQVKDTLNLKFPQLTIPSEVSGTIQFYSPVEEKRDLITKIAVDQNYLQVLDLNQLRNGRYFVKIDWEANGVKYYHESEISVDH
jgi:hypothetical protein